MSRRRFKRAKRRRRKRSLSASVWGPIPAFTVTLALYAALRHILCGHTQGGRLHGPGLQTPICPRAYPLALSTPIPTPTPNPMSLYDFLTGSSQSWFLTAHRAISGLPTHTFTTKKMVISCGQAGFSGKNVCSGTCSSSTQDRISEKINLTPQNDHFLFLKFNDKWLYTWTESVMAAPSWRLIYRLL